MHTVILADAHNLFRDGIKLIIENLNEFKVIAVADTGDKIIELLDSNLDPDIIICDLSISSVGELPLLETMLAKNPRSKILVMSADEDVDMIIKIINTGACGYIHKNRKINEFIAAVRQVATGELYLSPGHCLSLLTHVKKLVYSPNFVNRSKLPVFSDRELAILSYLGEGLTNLEISEKMFVSPRTVEGYRKVLISKTETKTTAKLIKYAAINGLIS